MTSTDNQTAVYGGWGKTPLGYVEGDSTMEISFTDAMFYEDLYAIGGTGSIATGIDTSVKGGGMYTVLTGPKIELPFQVNPTNVQIKGFTVGDTATAGKFTVTYDDVTKISTIAFYAGDVVVGESLLVTYERRVAKASVTTVTTTGGSARGSLTLTWAVMSSGDDCTQAAIVGYYHLKVPRVMVTTRPSLDTSRGSAATPNVVFSAIDAHRGDDKWYDLIFEELDNGIPSTDYSGGAFIWDDTSSGNLTQVKLATLAIGTETLTPTPFDPDTFAYTVNAANASDTVTATATGGAGVAITVNGVAKNSGDEITWDTGNNTVVIIVTKAGSASSTYIVTVIKAA